MTLSVQTNGTLGQIRLAVPDFCPQVTVLEVGTVADGVFYPAKSLGDGATFKVDGLASSGIGEIQASLNGPSTSSCYIPVYGRSTP